MRANAPTGFNFDHTIVRNAYLPIVCNEDIGRFKAAVYKATLMVTAVRTDTYDKKL